MLLIPDSFEELGTVKEIQGPVFGRGQVVVAFDENRTISLDIVRFLDRDDRTVLVKPGDSVLVQYKVSVDAVFGAQCDRIINEDYSSNVLTVP
mgnify:FL=1